MSNANIPMEMAVSDKALKLAKEWVMNMSVGDDGDNDEIEETEAKLDIRPARLGLGAKYVSHSQLNATLNPVEKKLQAKFQASKITKDVASTKLKDDQKNIENDESNEDEDSRSSVFNKKDNSKSSKTHSVEGFGRRKKQKTG